MITAFRIFKTKYSASWFDGEGAFRYGGRWNLRGTRVFYAAESLSLAALEMLVHLSSEQLLLSYSFAVIEFEEKLILPIEKFAELPKNWNNSPPPLEVQQLGNNWARSKISVVLEVPTSILPVEKNYIINIEHPDFAKIKLGKPQTFKFDNRLIG